MVSEVYVCDVCQKVKGEANHWHVLRRAVASGCWLIVLWHQAAVVDPRDDDLHFCGEECLFKALSERLKKG